MCFSGLQGELWAMGNPWIACVWLVFALAMLAIGCMFAAALADSDSFDAVLGRKDRKWTGSLFAAMAAITLALTPLAAAGQEPVTHFYHISAVPIEAIGPVNTDDDGNDYRLVKYKLNDQTKQTKVPVERITVDNGQDPKKSLKDVKTGTIKAQLTVKSRYYLYDRMLRMRLSELGAYNGLSEFNQNLLFTESDPAWLTVRLHTQTQPQKMQKMQSLDDGSK